jgi:hypothetical protein
MSKISFKPAALLAWVGVMAGHRRFHLTGKKGHCVRREQFLEDAVNKDLFNAIMSGVFRVPADCRTTVHIGTARGVAAVFDYVVTAALATPGGRLVRPDGLVA